MTSLFMIAIKITNDLFEDTDFQSYPVIPPPLELSVESIYN